MVAPSSTGQRPDASGRTPVVSPQDPCCGASGARADSSQTFFTPFSVGDGAGLEIPSTLRVTCTECGASTTLPVPSWWVPEGWERYD